MLLGWCCITCSNLSVVRHPYQDRTNQTACILSKDRSADGIAAEMLGCYMLCELVVQHTLPTGEGCLSALRLWGSSQPYKTEQEASEVPSYKQGNLPSQ